MMVRECSNCKHKSKGEDEAPCNRCERNASDMWEMESNADRIRSMSDEELADWIVSHDDATERNGRLERRGIVQWLKSSIR